MGQQAIKKISIDFDMGQQAIKNGSLFKDRQISLNGIYLSMVMPVLSGHLNIKFMRMLHRM